MILMLYLTLLTFGVFIVLWSADLALTIKTVNHMGPKVEINPIIKFILKTRRKAIYIIKPLELIIFGYLILFLNVFKGVMGFYILLVFILFYGLLVLNNSWVYATVAKKDSAIIRITYFAILLFVLLFIFLNYSLYNDLTVSYDTLSETNSKYNEIAIEYNSCCNQPNENTNLEIRGETT